MRAVKSKDSLAANFKSWAQRAGLTGSSNELAQKLELPQKTVYNILHGATNPYKTLDHLAEKMNVPPWQLLYPVVGDELFKLLRAYEKTTDEGRRLLVMAAETAEQLSD